MHILFAVHFNAPHGGLHENVFATVSHSLKKGHDVTVVCKEGEYATRLIKEGAQVITTDFESIHNTVEKVLNQQRNDYNVIHTHPGPSRKVAIKVSENLNIPLFMTFHGMWHDSLTRYANKLSAIFPVSEGVKDFLKTKLESHHEKMIVMPNGVNKKLFKPKKNYFKKANNIYKPLSISLVTRLDKDKDFIIQLFYKALEFTYKNYKDEVIWNIVGDGTELENMNKEVVKITNGGRQKVKFVGWKHGKDLHAYYLQSDIVLAPGRCALEAMSCGKPVIAIGSKKYNGLVQHNNWLQGMYTNFGGFGNKMDDYVEGTIEKELGAIIENKDLRRELGELGLFITDQIYNEETINDKILGFYELYNRKKP